MTYATEYGFPLWEQLADMALGWVTAQQGQVEDGIAQIRRGRDGWSDSGMVLNESFLSTFLVEGYALAGHPEEGLPLLAEALAMAERTGEGLWEAELHRLQGDLLRMQGAAEAEVEACFRQALDVARRQQAKWHELRASASLGRLWQQQGRQAEARALLAEIYDWFTEGFDTPVLKEARALLDGWS